MSYRVIERGEWASAKRRGRRGQVELENSEDVVKDLSKGGQRIMDRLKNRKGAGPKAAAVKVSIEGRGLVLKD